MLWAIEIDFCYLPQSHSKTGIPDANQTLFWVVSGFVSYLYLLCGQLSLCYLFPCLPVSKCSDCSGILWYCRIWQVTVKWHGTQPCCQLFCFRQASTSALNVSPLRATLAWYFGNSPWLQFLRQVPAHEKNLTGPLALECDMTVLSVLELELGISASLITWFHTSKLHRCMMGTDLTPALLVQMPALASISTPACYLQIPIASPGLSWRYQIPPFSSLHGPRAQQASCVQILSALVMLPIATVLPQSGQGPLHIYCHQFTSSFPNNQGPMSPP